MGVYQRGKNGRWWIDYYCPGGQRVREAVSIKGKRPSEITRRHALDALAIRKGEVAGGKFDIARTKKEISFDNLVSVFIKSYSKVNKRSWQRDVTSTKALMKYFGGKKLSQVSPWTVDKYKSRRLKETSVRGTPITKATVNRELACLKKMLSYAEGENWIVSNPLRRYKLFKERPNKIRVVSLAEFKMVYDNASEDLKTKLLIGFNTGMRKSEITGLKWTDVDLSTRLIYVADSKTGDPREVPVNDELYGFLSSLKEKARDEYVLPRMRSPIRNFKTAFENAVKKSGVAKFTFHDLRHTFASNLVMAGVDIATVQELLGHKSIVMTKRYSHPTREHKKGAVERVNSGVLDTNMVTDIIGLKTKGYASH